MRPKIKTVIIAHNYSEDSFSAMSYHLTHYLADNGFRIIFISHRPFFEKPIHIQKKIGEIYIFSWPTNKRPTTLRDVLWFSKIYFKFRPTIIIGHFVGSNIVSGISKLFSFGKSKTIVYYHTLTNQIKGDRLFNSCKHLFLHLRKKIFYNLFVDIIVCPSNLSKEDLKENFTINTSVIIPNPMLDRFQKKIVPKTDKIVISFLGRLDPSKGVKELVIAFEKYIIANPKSKILLQIAGEGKFTNELNDYANRVDNLKFFGSLKYSEVDNYLNQSHYTIIPSLIDNLPTVGLESMMNQTPLLISNSTGLSPYLTDGFDCFKFDASIDSIYEVFKRVEISDKIDEMGINARKLFSHSFSMPTYCEKMHQQIITILN